MRLNYTPGVFSVYHQGVNDALANRPAQRTDSPEYHLGYGTVRGNAR